MYSSKFYQDGESVKEIKKETKFIKKKKNIELIWKYALEGTF